MKKNIFVLLFIFASSISMEEVKEENGLFKIEDITDEKENASQTIEFGLNNASYSQEDLQETLEKIQKMQEELDSKYTSIEKTLSKISDTAPMNINTTFYSTTKEGNEEVIKHMKQKWQEEYLLLKGQNDILNEKNSIKRRMIDVHLDAYARTVADVLTATIFQILKAAKNAIFGPSYIEEQQERILSLKEDQEIVNQMKQFYQLGSHMNAAEKRELDAEKNKRFKNFLKICDEADKKNAKRVSGVPLMNRLQNAFNNTNQEDKAVLEYLRTGKFPESNAPTTTPQPQTGVPSKKPPLFSDSKKPAEGVNVPK